MHANNFCIVVAEDDEVLRYCTVRLLQQHGYKIIEARDGQEALELVEECDDPIHVLITNYDMPRLNGAELARRLKAKHEKLKVLVISGSDHGMQPSDDLEILTKPYNEAVLAAKVRELLRRSSATV
jgi:DNA-binding response OmpR family regulator